jgi:hypothetical protein
LVGAAVTQAFHHGNGCDRVRVPPAVLFGNGHSLHAERSASFPTITREHLLSVALDHVAVELATGKLNGCRLQFLLLRCQFKIHSVI